MKDAGWPGFSLVSEHPGTLLVHVYRHSVMTLPLRLMSEEIIKVYKTRGISYVHVYRLI